MEHPDLLLKLSRLRHQDELREVEAWRLAMVARQNRANHIGYLLQRLLTIARQLWRVHGRPKPAKPDLANVHR